MSRASRVPRDDNMAPEVRTFLDGLSRASDYVSRDGTADYPVLKQDGELVLTERARQTIKAGFDNDRYSLGTLSSGTHTIDPQNGQHQGATFNGSFTLSPASVTKDSTVVLHVINGASAGTVTFTGFGKKYPSQSLTTTNGHKFTIIMYFFGSDGADYAIFARQ
jgi:hypothetical protein